MFVFVSRKKFLEDLETVDYIKFGNLQADWPAVVNTCEAAVEANPTHWCSLVIDKTTFDSWDNLGDEYIESMRQHREWGYTPENTRSWETTSTKPQVVMPWEQAMTDQLPLQSGATSRPTLQKPGNIMPWHMDRFFYFRRNHPEGEHVIRFLYFMKDWEAGHMLQAGNSILSHWSAGDVIVWHPNRWHLSLNAGFTDKWTTNVTGILNEEIWIEN